MAYEVRALPIAQQDMSEAVLYIARDLANPAAAEDLAERFVAGMRSLESHPFRCPLYVPPMPLLHEYRKLKIGSYLMFYWVEEEKLTGTVARFVYARRELSRKLV